MWQNIVSIVSLISGIITIVLFVKKLCPYFRKEKTTYSMPKKTTNKNVKQWYVRGKYRNWKDLTSSEKNDITYEQRKPYAIIFAIIGGLITLGIVIKLIAFLLNGSEKAEISSGIILGIPLGALVGLGIFVFITEELQKLIDGDI
jgi:membrane protease YdiL (CAAX protease family)